MAWRDQLREASFRGATFKVDAHDHQFGRRQEIHEYPLRTKPWAEDLGRAARRYAVEGYVIGPDYFAARDALIAAVEAEGPGLLVHPYLGSVQVVCVEGSVREDRQRGGEATFLLQFVEAGDNLTPGIFEATDEQALIAADDSAVEAQEVFANDFSIQEAPSFVVDEAGSAMDQAMAAAELAADGIAEARDKLYGFQRQVGKIRTNFLNLARTPSDLAAGAIGVVRQLRQLADSPARALAALKPLTQFGADLDEALGDTPARQRQRANQKAIVQLIRQAAAAESVAAVAELQFDSYPAAVAVRDDLADRIDVIAMAAADAGDDAAWGSMNTLRLAMVRDVTARGGSLARLFGYTPAAPEPALVIAHRIYGDAGREAEIVARNGVRHPGFVPAGEPLELLTPDASEVS